MKELMDGKAYVQGLYGPPVRAVRHQTALGNLEPTGRRGRGSSGVVYFGHVHDDGTVVLSTDCLVAARALARLSVHFDGQ